MQLLCRWVCTSNSITVIAEPRSNYVNPFFAMGSLAQPTFRKPSGSSQPLNLVKINNIWSNGEYKGAKKIQLNGLAIYEEQEKILHLEQERQNMEEQEQLQQSIERGEKEGKRN
jgi:hypothetical protein